MALTFDTLKLAQKLENSGFSREQATGAAEALSENLSINKDDLVTKEQFSTLRTDFQTDLQNELKPIKSDIISLKTDMGTVKADITSLKTDNKTIKSDITSLKTDMAVVKAELGMIKWMMGGTVFGIFLLVVKTFLI